MKKILKLAAVVCAAVLFVSCGAKDDATQIKDAMEGYIKASASFDYGKLKSIVTPESVPMLEQAEKAMKNIPEEYKKMAEEAAKSVKFNAETVKITGETATATVNAMGIDTPITLKKVDGKWLIDMVGSVPSMDEVDVEEVIEETVDGTDAPSKDAENGATK